jgi:hypothetical protein
VERKRSSSRVRTLPANGCKSLALQLDVGCQPAESDIRRVKNDAEPSDELRLFIDQLIIPLLVERLLVETGDLYSQGPSYYDETQAA